QIAFIKPFYSNIRKELTKMPKPYFYDLGLRNLFLNNFDFIDKRADKGAYLENIIFREFLRTAGDINKIKFWRTQDKKEIDFIVDNKAFEAKFSQRQANKGKYKQFQKFYPDIKFNFLIYSKVLEKFYHWQL
ncbi:MAG: DUF4143 domain-containing protein, partial [Patescibacteria group bacterium]|nr:DUF4143 domain-containing protein [Patescibacteria group bacterium]